MHKQNLNNQYLNQNSRVKLNLIFGPGIVFRSELNHQLYRGVSDEFDTDYWLWSLGMAKKFMKNNRAEIALNMFRAWYVPLYYHGIIHGDPHLGNYQVTQNGDALNLLDFGCIRIFPPSFVAGVVDLYRAVRDDDFDASYAAYEKWGFENLTKDLVEVLNVWARFIYGPMHDDRVRTVADGVKHGEYGRNEAYEVRRLLKERGPVKIPREFVFMDRAAIGLGAAYLRLGAELNYHRLFEESLDGFDEAKVAAGQTEALQAVGL